MGVETGGCPHTAIREDASLNLSAVAEMRARFPKLDLILIESGGDNLAATFSPELADITIYVIDVAGGEKIPRKGGPGITRADLLVINKIDLAPMVGASLAVMEADTKRQRGKPALCVHEHEDARGPGYDRVLHRTPRRTRSLTIRSNMADGEGFEPPRGVNLCRFSRPVLLTTQPPVRMAGSITYSAAICYPQSKDQCSKSSASSRIASAREFRDPNSREIAKPTGSLGVWLTSGVLLCPARNPQRPRSSREFALEAPCCVS